MCPPFITHNAVLLLMLLVYSPELCFANKTEQEIFCSNLVVIHNFCCVYSTVPVTAYKNFFVQKNAADALCYTEQTIYICGISVCVFCRNIYCFLPSSFMVRDILLRFMSTSITLTFTTSPTFTASRGCLM